MDKKFELEVNASDYHETPTESHVIITLGLAKRIRFLAEKVKELKVYSVTEFEYSPEFQIGEKTWRTECNELVVTDDEFYWQGLVKHTDVVWTTSHIQIKDIEEVR